MESGGGLARTESVTSRIKNTISRADKNVKIFGCMTFFTLAVVIGMSVYVVHYKEFRFDVTGRSFVNDKGEMMLTDTPIRSVDSLDGVLKSTAEDLGKMKAISFFADSKDHGVFQSVMKVSRVDRFANGLARIYGAAGTSTYIQTNMSSPSAGAKFSDGGFCAAPPCDVVQDMQGKPIGAGRRLLARRDLGALADLPEHRGRKLWGSFGKTISSWFSSSPAPTPEPVWKADTSKCPWICRQGWWWQSNAYGKPACCSETKDSGSPYDTCQFDTCSCDASCRGCCD